jgi:hypothetical protein
VLPRECFDQEYEDASADHRENEDVSLSCVPTLVPPRCVPEKPSGACQMTTWFGSPYPVGSRCFRPGACSQRFQAVPQDRIELGTWFEPLKRVSQSSPSISLSKAQLAQRPEGPGVHERRRRRG